MHFSIPDVVQATDDNGANYWNFHIHVNGVYHCKLRYSQLDKFHEKLQNEYPERTPNKIFPGKKLFSLSGEQLEKRRLALEVYIQHLSQDPVISNSNVFNNFLLNAQRDGWDDPKEVDLNIYLMNGKKVSVKIGSNDQTEEVFEVVCEKIGLDKKYLSYFAMFLIQQESKNFIKIVRRLQEFESPYLSLISTDLPHKIVIRKNYNTSKFDNDLIEDRIAMNLLYVQVADDLQRGLMLCDEDIKEKLNELQAVNNRKEFLEMAKTCKYYGFTHFNQCIGDYPKPDSKLLVSCGERILNTRVFLSDNKIEEASFKVQRIRSWRLTSVPYSEESSENTTGNKKEKLFFAFEYLFSKDDLRWITIQSDQAIIISMTLQSIVDEIIREDNKEQEGNAGGNSATTSTTIAAKEKEVKSGLSKAFGNNKNSTFSWKINNESDANQTFEKQIGDDDL